jgi:hypothetical protein
MAFSMEDAACVQVDDDSINVDHAVMHLIQP